MAPILLLILAGAGILVAAAGKKTSGPGLPTGGAPSSTGTPSSGLPAGSTTTPGTGINLPNTALVSPEIQRMIAAALADGGAPSLTAAAFVAEQAGFSELAADLRARAAIAAKKVPQPLPAELPHNTIEPTMPPELSASVARALQLQADPLILDVIARELRTRGFIATAEQVEAKARQVRAAIDASQTMGKIDEIITSTGIPQPGGGSLPIPPSPRVTDIPTNIVLPTIAIPGSLPTEKAKAQIVAESTRANLVATVNKAGNVKAAKGKEDTFLVKKFQAQEGLKADGKFGPGAALKLANYVGDLPPVFYWPTGANAKTVALYRGNLETLALDAAGAGRVDRALELRASAARERGQSGIVGTMPA